MLNNFSTILKNKKVGRGGPDLAKNELTNC